MHFTDRYREIQVPGRGIARVGQIASATTAGWPAEVGAAILELRDDLTLEESRPTPLAPSGTPGTIECRVFGAELGGVLVGTVTLVIMNLMSAKRALVEDMVVQSEARGLGLGRALTMEVIECATAEACISVDLTSRPERVAANYLYASCGFVPRKTNMYRKLLHT